MASRWYLGKCPNHLKGGFARSLVECRDNKALDRIASKDPLPECQSQKSLDSLKDT